MQRTYLSAAARARSPCAFCTSRDKGVCQGIGREDGDAVSALDSARLAVRMYDAGEVIYAQGDAAEYVFTLISGWVAVHRDLPDGRRQITRFLQPGALFGIEPAGEEFGHSATAITNTTVCPIKISKFEELRRGIASLNEQFVRLLEWEYHNAINALTTLGQGSAKERVGGLLWDLSVAAIGEASYQAGAMLKLPLTQRHIADATGLTSIHVNRVLRQLREEGVIALRDGRLTIIDARRLQAIINPGADRRCGLGGERRDAARPAVRLVSATAGPAATRYERIAG
jgi:CRP-like cAMP-binding protein